jgi:E3 ubiquitin-protein ligase HERC1
MMSWNRFVRTKWADHTSLSWCVEKDVLLVERNAVNDLYNKLVTNQEVVIVQQANLQTKSPVLPDFDRESVTTQEQEHFLNVLFHSQFQLAQLAYSHSSFAIVLQKRLLVLQRMIHSIASKYHARDKNQHADHSGPAETSKSDKGTVSGRGVTADGSSRSGTDALIEMGVKTGLSLVFALLRQNWNTKGDESTVVLCTSVLQTAIDVVSSLPALSLSSDVKLSGLGTAALSDVVVFLKNLMVSGVDVHPECRRLSAELMLTIAVQRGSLRHMLEWIESALRAAAANSVADSGTKSAKDLAIRNDVLLRILQQMVRSYCDLFMQTLDKLCKLAFY